jgi:hypothetical protein
MAKALVVHFRKAEYDVYIGRPTKWGNPFLVGRDGVRGECIAKYAAWIRTQPDLMDSVVELRGKVLGCWCAPRPCHGDVLAELADEAAEREFDTAPPCTERYEQETYGVVVGASGSVGILQDGLFAKILSEPNPKPPVQPRPVPVPRPSGLPHVGPGGIIDTKPKSVEHTASHRIVRSTSGMSAYCSEPGCSWTYEYD